MIPLTKKRKLDSICGKRQPWKHWKYSMFAFQSMMYISLSLLIVCFLATLLSFRFMISVPGIQEYSMNLCSTKLISENNDANHHSLYFPRVVRYVETMEQLHKTTLSYTAYKSVRIDPNIDKYPSKRLVVPLGNLKLQQAIENDDEYYGNQVLDSDITEECQLRYNWQKVASIPTCNRIHEFDVSSLSWEMRYRTNIDKSFRKKRYGIIGQGFWSSVFLASQQDSITVSTTKKTNHRMDDSWFVFKTLRYRHEFTLRNFNRMRREALIMERLTSSPFVINVYAFCGTSSFSEYGEGKDIAAAIWPSDRSKESSGDTVQERRQREKLTGLSPIQKLHIATQAAIGLADLHTVDSESEASIAHTDISPNQYVKVKGVYKLNDFNRARFIPWSNRNKTTCTYRIGSNPGKNRAPEEYKLEPQSEKVDVYSLGNIFYMLLQEEYPFNDIETDEAQKLVMQGHRPTFYVDVWNSTDPVDQAIKAVMLKCHEQDPILRPTAREVSKTLTSFLRKFDPGRLEKWGFQ